VWSNYEELMKLNTPQEIADALLAALPDKAKQVRIHAGGDFFSQHYFDAWLIVAEQRPDVRFWAFTKSIPFWATRIGDIPANLVLTASNGGKHDQLAKELNLRTATVFGSYEVAEESEMEIDENDRLAMQHGPSFALILNSKKKRK